MLATVGTRRRGSDGRGEMVIFRAEDEPNLGGVVAYIYNEPIYTFSSHFSE
jgi:hypothetical protein